ncbi:replication endonuclease, partial [Vibrio vulnificus]|nr:replication endonuclease [Vibrio vulnificus]
SEHLFFDFDKIKNYKNLDNLKVVGIFNTSNYTNASHKQIKNIGKLVSSVLLCYLEYIQIDNKKGNSLIAFEVISFTDNFISHDLALDMKARLLTKNNKAKANFNEAFNSYLIQKTMALKYYRLVKHKIMNQDMSNKEIGSSTTIENAVNKDNHNTYVSNRAKKLVSTEKKDSIKAMSKLKTKTGKTLLSIAKTAKAQFTEMYIELKALEKLAVEKKMTWLFITLTCPSRYHSNPNNGNCSYRGATIKEAKNYLQERFRYFVKRTHKPKYSHLKFSIDNAFGKKILEAHQDATPHFHVILFCHESNISDYKELFSEVFGEKGLDIRQAGYDENNNKIADKDIASAASYVCKYLLKQFDLEVDKDGDIVSSSSNHMTVWRSMTQFRSHSSFGYKSTLTKYRLARSIINASRQKLKQLYSESHESAFSHMRRNRIIEDAACEITKEISINAKKRMCVPPSLAGIVLRVQFEKILDNTSVSKDDSYNLDITHLDVRELFNLNNITKNKSKKMVFASSINNAEKQRSNDKETKNLVDYSLFVKSAHNINILRDKETNTYNAITNESNDFEYSLSPSLSYADFILDSAYAYRARNNEIIIENIEFDLYNSIKQSANPI